MSQEHKISGLKSHYHHILWLNDNITIGKDSFDVSVSALFSWLFEVSNVSADGNAIPACDYVGFYESASGCFPAGLDGIGSSDNQLFGESNVTLSHLSMEIACRS